ncbi:DUF6273 domain-containing protein [Flintibacter porci]|uniref:DUF6273 domain-containing protein n=1 Tax=Flintibacter porci TaxID=3342383 RepID=UPI003F8CC219
MATVALSTKAVGSTVKLKVNGTAREFLVVHQGRPSTLYDSSCDGTWLLMKDIYENRQWHSSNSNSYKASTIHTYLNGTFLNLFEADIREAIKQVKIPYVNGTANSAVASGANGLSCKIFLLSGYEVGWTQSDNQYFPVDGAKLSYFTSGTSSAANNKRIANYNGSATGWWLRSPYTNYSVGAWLVDSNGNYYYSYCSNSYGIRPALVLPSNLLVSDDGSVQTNTPPTITSTSGSSGVNLGTKSAAFSFKYTPSDADGDKLTVTEKLDGVTKKTRSNVTSGTQLTFECASTAAEFQKILNGSHTITIEVSDGQEKATFTATFTKAVTQATITLDEPLAVEGDITVAILAVTGEIPVDADYTVEVTNNAKDTSPVWQDATTEVKNGTNIVFENHTNTNGAAFNFRITVKRGSSNTGGYISGVSGAFQ